MGINDIGGQYLVLTSGRSSLVGQGGGWGWGDLSSHGTFSMFLCGGGGLVCEILGVMSLCTSTCVSWPARQV